MTISILRNQAELCDMSINAYTMKKPGDPWIFVFFILCGTGMQEVKQIDKGIGNSYNGCISKKTAILILFREMRPA